MDAKILVCFMLCVCTITVANGGSNSFYDQLSSNNRSTLGWLLSQISYKLSALQDAYRAEYGGSVRSVELCAYGHHQLIAGSNGIALLKRLRQNYCGLVEDHTLRLRVLPTSLNGLLQNIHLAIETIKTSVPQYDDQRHCSQLRTYCDSHSNSQCLYERISIFKALVDCVESHLYL